MKADAHWISALGAQVHVMAMRLLLTTESLYHLASAASSPAASDASFTRSTSDDNALGSASEMAMHAVVTAFEECPEGTASLVVPRLTSFAELPDASCNQCVPEAHGMTEAFGLQCLQRKSTPALPLHKLSCRHHTSLYALVHAQSFAPLLSSVKPPPLVRV